jgi:hypothetical protein
MVEREVCCAGVSYFVREPVLGAFGEGMTNDRGEEVFVTIRKEATVGAIIELSSFEAKRLQDLGAVQEPGAYPLPGDPKRPVQATPFGVPVVDHDADPDEDGNQPLTAFKGPVMGDPTPVSQVAPNDANALASPTLTAEEAARLEQAALDAAGKNKENEEDAAALREGYEEESKTALRDEAEAKGIEVQRADGRADREPTKLDYVEALVQHSLSEEDDKE